MSLEEIVATYKTPSRTETHAKQVLCETTGELGSVRFFAERIAAVRNTKLGSERAKIYRSIMLGTKYRNLKFSEIPK